MDASGCTRAGRCRIRGERALLLIVPFLLAAPAVAAVVWPANDSDWTATTQGGSGFLEQKDNKKDKSWDIRGDGTYSAGYYYLDDANLNLLFRIRVNNRPTDKKKGTWDSHVWQVLLDTDGDSSDIDWVLQLDQVTDNQVELAAVTHGSPDTWANVSIGSEVWGSSS